MRNPHQQHGRADEQRRPETPLVGDQRPEPCLPRLRALPPFRIHGPAKTAVDEPGHRDGVSQGGGDHHPEPGGKVVRVDEGARYAPGRRGRSRDPDTGRLRQEPQAGEQSACGEQGEQQPIEDRRARIVFLDRRAPGIRHGDQERSEPDREPAELRPDTVGVDGEGPPDRPAPVARPAGQHLGVQARRGGREQAKHRRGQGHRRRQREPDQDDQRRDARRIGRRAAPAPFADRDGEQHEDHGRGGGQGPGLAPAQKERQPEHEPLQGEQHLAVALADGGETHAEASGRGGW